MDEVSLALVTDAWSRTYRSKAVTFATSGGAVETAERRIYTFSDRTPVDALDQALLAIAAHYGDRTTNVVAVQLEYPR